MGVLRELRPTDNIRQFGYITSLDADFILFLRKNLFSTKGSQDISFSRSSTATVTDYEGLIRDVKDIEARFEGARRVENLIQYSEDLTQSNWTKQTGVTVEYVGDSVWRVTNTTTTKGLFYALGTGYAGRDIELSVEIKKDVNDGQVSFADGYGGATTLTQVLTNDWVKISNSISNVVTSVGFYLWNFGTASSFLMRFPQAEDVSGQADQSASEYVSSGVATGNNILTNGTFDTDTDWTKQAGWTISGGTANVDSSVGGTTNFTSNDTNIKIGKTYVIEYTINSLSGTGIRMSMGGYIEPVYHTTAGSVKDIFTATTTTALSFTAASTDTVAQIDNVTVKIADHGANVDGVKYFTTDKSGNDLTGLKGYLCEKQSTNLLTYSEDFSDSSWIKNEGTISTISTTTPNGDGTVTKFIPSTNYGSNHDIRKNNSMGTVLHTFSSYLKPAGYDWVRMFFVDGDGTVILAYFDILNGVVGTTNANTKAIIEDVGNGWFRCLLSSTVVPSATSNQNSFINVVNGDNSASFSGDGTSGVYIWGTQLEESPFATSYIPTTTSTVTRSADNLDIIPSPATTDITMIGEFTPKADGADYGAGTTGELRLFASDDSRGPNYEFRTSGTTTYDYIHTTGSGYLNIRDTDIVTDTTFKMGISLSQNGNNIDYIASKDGTTKLNSSTAGTQDHSNTSLNIGYWQTNAFTGNVKAVKIYNQGLKESELRDETR